MDDAPNPNSSHQYTHQLPYKYFKIYALIVAIFPLSS